MVTLSRSKRDLDRLQSVISAAARLKPIAQLRFYDTTTISRCHNAFDHDGSNRNYDLRSIRLRYDYDTTTTKN